jgi:glycosyltransferase involved in cell wall biosynthesis
MRVLYVLDENINRTGGGIVHFLAISRNLKKLGHDVVVLGPKYNFKIRPLADVKGVFIPLPGRNILSFLLFHFIAALIFPLLMCIYRPQAMLIRGGGIGPFWLLCGIGRLLGIRVILEVNGISWMEIESRGFNSFIVKLARLSTIFQVKLSNAIICVTPAIGDELSRVSNFPNNRVFFVSNGVEPDEFYVAPNDQFRYSLGLKSDDFIVGFTGLFDPWHGIMELVQSAKYLPPEIRQHICYLLVGDGKMLVPAKSWVQAENLKKEVLFPGWATREQIKNYLSIFNVGVFITTDENKKRYPGSPLKFFEYLAAGLPVIVTGDSYLSPMVDGDKMGFILSDATPETIAACIAKAYIEREEMSRIGCRNRRLAETKYSWLEMSKKVARVLAGEGNENKRNALEK